MQQKSFLPPMNEDQKQQVIDLVDEKMTKFSQNMQQMVNNFQIEIIRQFEIQKSQMEGLIEEYLLDEEDKVDNEVENDLVRRVQ